MRLALIAAAAFCTLASVGAYAAAPAVSSALDDAARPAADKARDAERKAAEVLAFSEVKPGDKVADIYPGGGYFTRLFAASVGANGKVYMFVPAQVVDSRAKPVDSANAVKAGYQNVEVLVQKTAEFKPPEKLDIVFSSQFYHDMYSPTYGGAPIAAINKAVFDALKPGGLYVIVDHSAPDGSGLRDVGTTHRIDEAAAKKDLTAAGFQLVGESQMLRNPEDKRDINVFQPAIRGKTDQFVLKFRKPR